MPVKVPPFPSGGYAYPNWRDNGTSNWTTPQPIGPPIFSRPIPALETDFILSQDFAVHMNNFQPIAMNTPHPNPAYSNYVLVKEGDCVEMGNGILRWTRTYLAIPTSYNEWEQYTYTFPGITSPDGQFTRLPLTQRVISRVQNDFFLVDPSLSNNAPGAAPYPLYYDAGQIPILQPFKVVNQFVGTGASAGKIFGGWWNQLTTTSVAGATLPSIPTSQVYIGLMMQDAVNNGWGIASTVTTMVIATDNNSPYSLPNTILNYNSGGDGRGVPPGTIFGGQIPTDPSTVKRFMGNVWLRQTRFVLAI